MYKVVETTTGNPFVLKRMQVNRDNDVILACVRCVARPCPLSLALWRSFPSLYVVFCRNEVKLMVGAACSLLPNGRCVVSAFGCAACARACPRRSPLQSTLHPHRNIVRYVASEVRETPDYVMFDILMEFCSGGSAAGKLKELQDLGSRVSEVMLMRWLYDLSSALAHLHGQSPPVAHRDVKAENMLLAGDGTVKLCDFGSATTRAGTYESYAVRRPGCCSPRGCADIVLPRQFFVCVCVGAREGESDWA